MGFSLFFVFLAVGMITTGSLNTISAKYADITSSEGVGGKVHLFNHPFFQALCMFVGEMLCMLAYRAMVCYKPDNASTTPFNPIIFLIPACCDMTATSLMYVGLNWTYTSVFQMLRGSVVIFTGIFSMIFLKKKLYPFHWIGMLCVLGGLLLVGAASLLLPTTQDASNPLVGDILIVAAQIVVAVQMVVEEKFVSKYSPNPLQVVGW